GSIETYRGVRPECQDARRSGVPVWTCRPRLAQGRECASARAFAPPARGAGHKRVVNLVQLSGLALATGPRRFASYALTCILVCFGCCHSTNAWSAIALACDSLCGRLLTQP